VAIIAGYTGQAHALDRAIQRNAFPPLNIEVATVDRFQGKKSNVCIFSVTLKNTGDYLGLSRSMHRLKSH
jgi:superfamily I DNA and/or RNA helicase